jgi:F-box-like
MEYVSWADAGTITDLDGIDITSSRPVTIASLPDTVLLDIFDFYELGSHLPQHGPIMDSCLAQSWHVLVHVCRGWRYIVFTSKRRLRLRLKCNATTPVREMLDIWPCLPIIVTDPVVVGHLDGDNIIAALELRDRVCEINLGNLTSSLLERLKTTFPTP